MTDVLKLAEEALVNLHSFAQPHNRMTDEPWAWMEREYAEALTALRTARAEWDWRPIADTPDDAAEAREAGEQIEECWLGRDGWKPAAPAPEVIPGTNEAREATQPTAAEVIAAAEKALRCGKWESFTRDEREMLADALAKIARWKEANGGTNTERTSR